MCKAIGLDSYNLCTTGSIAKAMTAGRNDKNNIPCVIVKRKSYGFFPQMKAEGIAFKEEKAGSIVIGTNPGYQNGVLIVDETDRNDSRPSDTES